ncbi:MAG: alpha/beta fold hydrolase [Alphaproteobacteria bacterium]
MEKTKTGKDTIKDIIFVHGWGEDPRIWDDIAANLPETKHHFVNLGFINNDQEATTNTIVLRIKSAIFVTHSLGTIWTLRHIPPKKIDALLAINGFGCFSDFASNKTLKVMAKTLQRNTFFQMEMFWKNCNLPESMRTIYKPVLDRRVLLQGLTWLGSWDERKHLQAMKARGMQVLPLGGEDDLILPLDKMKAHWDNLGCSILLKENAGHALPLSHPQWCAGHIKAMVKALELPENKRDKGVLS